MNMDILIKIINKIKILLHISFDKLDYLAHPNRYSENFSLRKISFESAIESSIFNNDIELLETITDFSYRSFYGDNAFHLIAKHSKDEVFFMNAFNHVFKYIPESVKEFNMNNYNLIDCLVVNNLNFHKSKLISVMPLLFKIFNVEEQESTKDYGHTYYFYKDFKTTIFDLKMNSLLNKLIYEICPVEICNYLDVDERKLKKYPSMKVWFDYRELFVSNDLKFICSKLTGSAGKRVRKLYMDKVINGESMDNIIAFDYVDRIISNYDIKLDYIDRVIKYIFIDIRSKKMHNLIKVLKDSEYAKIKDEMSDHNKVKFFIDPLLYSGKGLDNYLEFIPDTIRMYFELKRKTAAIDEEFKIDLSEFKHIKALHDWLSVELQKIKVKEFKFDNEKFEFINNINFVLGNNQYELKLPKTNHEIIMLGATLHICIGSSHYIDKHFNKKAVIILLYKNNEIFGAIDCLPDSSLSIAQAKLYANMYLPRELENKIQEELTISCKKSNII